MTFFEFWRRTKESGELLRRTNQLRLNPSELSRLLGNDEVRAALQNNKMVSLLPPVGMEVFRRLTPASLDDIQQRHEAEEERRRMKIKEATKDGLSKPAAHLEASKPLPFIYGDPSPELHSTPLEELDPFYQSKKTFIVLSKGNIIFRFNADSSCFLLSPLNPLRTLAIKILIHPWFSLFMLLTILFNCTFMKVDSPGLSRAVGYVFTAVYTAEAFLKVISRGCCVGRFTFLRDPWNWLDVIIISTAFLAELVDFGKFSVLMTIPRVMKIFGVIPGLKKTVEAFIQSVKRLADVIILMAFCLSVCAVFGLQFFMGNMKNKCVMMPFVNETERQETGGGDFDYHQYIADPLNQYHLPGHFDALMCGNTSHAGVCPEGYVCLRAGRNPDYGYTNYDSFSWSLLVMVRLMMEHDCFTLLQMTARAAGTTSMIVFMLVFLPSCFFLLSLIVAVVAMAVADQEDAGTADAKQREEEFSLIMEVLKRRDEEEEQASSRAALPEEQDSPQKKNSVTPSHEQGVAMEDGGRRHWTSCCAVVDPSLKGNCCGCWRGRKQGLHPFVMNPFFDLGIITCLVLNTVLMAMEHYPMTHEMDWLLSVGHLIFTGIFTAEMVLKLVALGLYGYFQVSWHIFDFIVVVTSLVELGLADVHGLSVLRTFRLLRMMRLARWWPTLHMFLRIIWTSVGSLTVVLLVMVFMFNVVGMQLFQEDYKDQVCRIALDCQLPRWHMHDTVHTFLLIFKILVGEWTETMFDCMEVSDHGTCVIFFMMVLVVGNLLVLNLFLKLLLSSFSYDNLKVQAERGTNSLQTRVQECIRTLLGKRDHADPDHKVVDTKKDNKKEYLALTLVTPDQPSVDCNLDKLPSDHGHMDSSWAPVAKIKSKTPENEEERRQQDDVVQQLEDDESQKGNTPEDCCCDSCYRYCPFLDVDTSQGRGRVWSNFRRTCLIIVQNKYFEAFIVFIILLSSAALVFEDIHLQQRPVLRMVLDRAELVFTVVFLVEMLLKWAALGVKKYFSSFWCWLDFLILDVSLLSLVLGMLGYSCRPLRTLRTLRTLSRFQGMRVVLRALAASLPFFFDLLLVLALVWLLFSLLGVALFAGSFHYCSNMTSEEYFLSDSVNNKSECLSLIAGNFSEVCWRNTKFNFDNVWNAYVSLLVLGTSAGWTSILYSAVDSREVESQPQYESNLYVFPFFICYIIIGCFFSFNFFIRGFVEALHLQRHKFGGKHVFTTDKQQKYIRAARKWFSKEPEKPAPRPQNQCQARLFDLVTSLPFEIFMVVVICMNMLTLMVETLEDSTKKYEILHWFCFTFIVIFLIEFFLKIIALRRHYFSRGLNILDFFILLVSIIDLFLSDFIIYYYTTVAVLPVLRLARIGPILRHIPCTRGIRMLLLGFMMSLPALLNIGLLFFLILYTFSCIGMFNFAFMKKEELIDDMFNFETFGSSMISLMMVTMSSSWDLLLSPIMNMPPDCDPDAKDLHVTDWGWTSNGSCSSPAVGIVFFTSYIILFFLLVVHLFAAVILETFNARDPEDNEPLSEDHLQMFYKTWRKFDPDGSQVIQYSELSDFCDALQDPLGIPKPNTIRLIHMDLPLLPGDQIHCLDVLRALSVQVLGESGQADALKARLEEKFKITKVSCEPISSTLRKKQEDVAAAVIQRAYRKHLQDGGAEGAAVQAVSGANGVSGDSGSTGLDGASQ